MGRVKGKAKTTIHGPLTLSPTQAFSSSALLTSYPSLAWYQTIFDSEQRMAFIQHLGQQIGAQFHPEKVILFGSQAYEQPTPDSDIDLLVVMNYQGRHTTQAIKILTQLKSFAPVDLLVRTPAEVQERLALGDQFMREIIKRGKVIYENNHARMD